MTGFRDATRAASLAAIAAALFAAVAARPAFADTITFIGGENDIDNSWENSANWSPATVPGSGDDVVVPASTLGAVILDGDSEAANSLELDSSFSVGGYPGGGSSLTVTNGITNNGGGYFINNGIVTVKDGLVRGTITNTYTSDEVYGYVGNNRTITANLDNSGAVVNGDGANGLTGVSWTGNVINAATGYISNTGAVWSGDITSNHGSIYNDYGSTWDGDIQSNDANIQNDGGSTWTGDIVGNGSEGGIANIEGAAWNGKVLSNNGTIDNDGGTWNGSILSNDGTVYNTLDSTWNGNMTSGGSLWLNGAVNGFVDNEGGTLYVMSGDLWGIATLTNNGDFTMDDGAAASRVSAQSWTGTGTATFDFAPGLGRSDYVVLSGDYTAATTLDLDLVGPRGRALVDIPLIEVGGDNTGTLAVNGLPGDGVISYRLVSNDDGWFVTTSLNDAPAHAAQAAALLARTSASVTMVPTAQTDACGQGRWIRALSDLQSGTLAGTQSGVALGGMQGGDDIACIAVGRGATLGLGVTAGVLGGGLSDDFGRAGQLSGSFGQGFAGLYGDLAAGPLHAMLQGQVGVAGLRISDPQSAVASAGLTSIRYALGGDATYDIAFGSVSLVPEVGFTASNVWSGSDDLADVGAMDLSSGATLDTYAGATLRGRVLLHNGVTTFAPYASLLLHDEPLSPDTALFTDLAGGSATVPLAPLGAYTAIELGADFVRAPGPSGQSLRGGFRADLKYGPALTENSYSAYAQVRF